MDSKDKVLEIMKNSGKPLRISEIAKLSGLEKNVVEKTIKELKAKDLIFSPERCCWQIK